MQLVLDDSLTTLLAEIREFIALREWSDSDAARRRFMQALDERGWGAPGWPIEHGGLGWSAAEQYLLTRELTSSGAPSPDRFLIEVVGPLLMADDSPAVLALLAGIRTGSDVWAFHASLFQGHPPIAEQRDQGIWLQAQRLLVRGARSARYLLVLVEPAAGYSVLGVADLSTATVQPGQPLDPDVVQLPAVRLQCIGGSDRGSGLWREAMARQAATPGCFASGLKHQLSLLRDRAVPDPDLASAFARFEQALAALEAMELRAVFDEHADSELTAVVRLKQGELRQELAGLTVNALGYYALPSYDPDLMGNEGRLVDEPGADAIAELFGYVDDGLGVRDRIAASKLGS